MHFTIFKFKWKFRNYWKNFRVYLVYAYFVLSELAELNISLSLHKKLLIFFNFFSVDIRLIFNFITFNVFGLKLENFRNIRFWVDSILRFFSIKLVHKIFGFKFMNLSQVVKVLVNLGEDIIFDDFSFAFNISEFLLFLESFLFDFKLFFLGNSFHSLLHIMNKLSVVFRIRINLNIIQFIHSLKKSYMNVNSTLFKVVSGK